MDRSTTFYPPRRFEHDPVHAKHQAIFSESRLPSPLVPRNNQDEHGNYPRHARYPDANVPSSNRHGYAPRHQDHHRSYENGYSHPSEMTPPHRSLPGVSALLATNSPTHQPYDDRNRSWSSPANSPARNGFASHSYHHNVHDPYRHHRVHSPAYSDRETPVRGSFHPIERSPRGSSSDDESTNHSSSVSSTGKSSRYLREMDRRAILERLANGEKQAALAKEYQVSRAAICNLNKHRDEVLSRTDENPYAKHPKKRKARQQGKSEGKPDDAKEKNGFVPTAVPSDDDAMMVDSSDDSLTAVHVFQSRAMQLLLTKLRCSTTPLPDFRRCCERVMRLVLEDALALVPVKPIEVSLNDQVKVEGVGLVHPPCAISMEQRQCPMMDMFHLLEPEQPTGYVRVEPNSSSNAVTLLDAHLPSDLQYHNVFLFDAVAVSGELICTAIQQLKNRGAMEKRVFVVALFVSSEVIAMVQCKFPSVQIAVAQIDSTLNKRGGGVGLDTLLSRLELAHGSTLRAL